MSALTEYNETQKSRKSPLVDVTGVACAGCTGAMWRIEVRQGGAQNAIAYCTGLHRDMYDHRKFLDSRIAYEDWKEKGSLGSRPENSFYSYPAVCDGIGLAEKEHAATPE